MLFIYCSYIINLKTLPVAVLVNNKLETVRKEVEMGQFVDAGIILSRHLFGPAPPE
jgi:hypothetical protein